MATFKLHTPLLGLQRFDLEFANPDILNPGNAAADGGVLESGMWVALDENYKAIGFEPGAICTPAGGSAESMAVHQAFTELGRSDVQAIQKATFLWAGAHEAETDQFVQAEREHVFRKHGSLAQYGLDTVVVE